MNDTPDDKGTPDEALDAVEAFHRSLHQRSADSAEDDALLNLALHVLAIEDAGYRESRADTPMALEFDPPLRAMVLDLLASTMREAALTDEAWLSENEPASLLYAARALRDSAAELARAIERLWPNLPPSDYGRI